MMPSSRRGLRRFTRVGLPTFGGVGGGFEVVMAEGFAHLDVVTAEDNADNPIPAALLVFLQRNIQ
jgi:hypothetical protein